MTARLPIGIVIRTIQADPVFWLESARRLDEAGYASVWAWDHLMGPPPGRPTLEASPWVKAPRATWARWREAGADGAVILARSPADIDALVHAVERW